MVNKFGLSVICALFVLATSCSSVASKSNQNAANKSLIDSAADTVFGEATIGIPECDRVLAKLDEPANANESTQDALQRRAKKQVIYNLIKDKSGAANMKPEDRAFYARRCAEIGDNFFPAQKNNTQK